MSDVIPPGAPTLLQMPGISKRFPALTREREPYR
jgi:hypothetical protein